MIWTLNIQSSNLLEFLRSCYLAYKTKNDNSVCHRRIKQLLSRWRVVFLSSYQIHIELFRVGDKTVPMWRMVVAVYAFQHLIYTICCTTTFSCVLFHIFGIWWTCSHFCHIKMSAKVCFTFFAQQKDADKIKFKKPEGRKHKKRITKYSCWYRKQFELT